MSKFAICFANSCPVSTRMHSSRMCTVRSSSRLVEECLSRGMFAQGECLPRRLCLPRPGVCLGGCLPRGGVCLGDVCPGGCLPGGVCPGGCLPRGVFAQAVVSAQVGVCMGGVYLGGVCLRWGVKTLCCCNYVADGKNNIAL